MEPSVVTNGREFLVLGAFVPGQDTFGVCLPSGITRQDELYAALAQGLAFPDYFGWNWNALDECLNDLSWPDRERVVLYHQDVPFAAGSQDRRVYLEILGALGAEGGWRDPVGPRVDGCACFPVACRARWRESWAKRDFW